MGESGLNRKQQQAIEALTRGCTRSEAARGCGVSERTLYRWLKEPEFAAALKEASESLWQAVLFGLRSGVRRSLNYLLSVLDDDTMPPRERLVAARTLLNTGLKILEFAEIEALQARVGALEEQLGGQS